MNHKTNQSNKNNSEKLPDNLHHRRKPTTKYRNHEPYKFYRTKHANTKKLWRTVEDTTRHQFDPIGNVINLSNKTFIKIFQLLNKKM